MIKSSGLTGACSPSFSSVVRNSRQIRDRYDVLNLLTSLPTFLSPPSPATTTETRGQQEEEDERGFTDLGSDSEELFYFIPSERATIARQKKRIKLEYAREERLKAKEREEKSTVESVEGADMEVRLPSLFVVVLSSFSLTYAQSTIDYTHATASIASFLQFTHQVSRFFYLFRSS